MNKIKTKKSKLGKTILVLLALLSILPSMAAAIPGIDVTTTPSSITTTGGATIDYQVKITNLDDGYAKTITSLAITSSQPGWTYTFDPDLTGQTIPAGSGNSITTTLHVTAPPGASPDTYSHTVSATVEYELFRGFPVPESDPDTFNTQIPPSTPIPEFPTVALPVLAVFGLLFVVRRKQR
jgi:hypothetical protein